MTAPQAVAHDTEKCLPDQSALQSAVGPGRARTVAAWRHLDRLPAWLDAARRACRAPPPEASKAAEWFLDNEYHIRRAVRQVRYDMPAAFYRRLPRSAWPEAQGCPRAFVAARSYLKTTHTQMDMRTATDFLKAFQHGEDLYLAELWAFPAMLRLAALEEIVSALLYLLPTLKPPFWPMDRSASRANRDPTEVL